ncbi:hypothetical protein EIKCOROL_00628 [Eikenella corrodens ATCC 23834]|uniref:Uncharacterized protein n=1 Tax=Eikenella corrodens ATCC 23834 TaxID=546274 RepID=C0DTF1_EIKCO|nr:hypothetical protein EIKCOROL_00628 [Eikenella corrodens ATCC 23834]
MLVLSSINGTIIHRTSCQKRSDFHYIVVYTGLPRLYRVSRRHSYTGSNKFTWFDTESKELTP